MLIIARTLRFDAMSLRDAPALGLRAAASLVRLLRRG
jgi:hypothetical protein